MAQINLENYETVEERIRRFYGDNPAARITTELVSVDGEPGKSRWIVKAFVYRDAERERPDSTGYAFEIDGAGMTQKAAALETCETSAIGRALANLNYSGNRRATREEMAKVQRHESPPDPSQHPAVVAAGQSSSADDVKVIGAEARAQGAPQLVIDAIAAIYREKAS